ncbi:hypothetical protein [Pseudomonas sp.]|uniref:hypothetical protein n=1 Tax=Pseudomonas sp. TaxID=306 RepID=UPI003D6ECA39
MNTKLWCQSASVQAFPTSILESAHVLVMKTACLSALLAPDTAACLSELIQVTSAHYSRVIDGYNIEQEFLKRAVLLENQQYALGEDADLARRIVAIFDHHYQILRGRPHSEGNGTVARMVTHQQFAQLGLHPHLWSLSRGLARKYEEYQRVIWLDDHIGKDGLVDGRQFTRDGSLLSFVEFMLHVCHEEVDYIASAFNRHQLRQRVLGAFRVNQRLLGAGVKVETAPAVLALLIQGSLPKNEFKIFTGLPSRSGSDELNRLRDLGVVANSKSQAHRVEPRLPGWFAEEILPYL